MEVDRPGPGEELNEGEVTEPRQAATAMVLRDGERGLEVLLVRRNPEARFMGGAWVFPGGAVHPDDGDHAHAALRELREEADIDLADAGVLVPFSRWITPAALKVRFDMENPDHELRPGMNASTRAGFGRATRSTPTQAAR